MIQNFKDWTKNLNITDKFEICYDMGIISKQSIPAHIKFIEITGNYVYEIKSDILPLELKGLDLGHWYNYKINTSILPDNLIYLKMSNVYGHEFDINTFPSKLKYLELGFCYHHKIKGNILPNGLEYLYLPGRFNIQIPQPLPTNLTHLYLGQNPHYNLNDIILPPKLYLISFSGIIKCNRDNSFYPESLKVMQFTSSCYGDNILNNLPHSVEILDFVHLKFFTNIPPTIKIITYQRDEYKYSEKLKTPVCCAIINKECTI